LTLPHGCGETLFMIRGFFLLLLFQLVGEVAARGLGLPAPGPVVGLALLVGALALYRAWRPFDDETLAQSDLGRAAAGLLSSLSLMFVPAGVGMVQYLGLLKEQGVAIAAALLVSTLATLLATVGAFLLVKRLIGLRREA
jgi:holin-like protein